MVGGRGFESRYYVLEGTFKLIPNGKLKDR